MRAIWSGSISFGLINIPIKVFPATDEKSLQFHYLHKQDLSPVRYAKICRADGKEIPYADIVRGYEYQPDDYVVLTDQELEQVNVDKTKRIEIQAFVKREEIDEVLFEKPYFLGPDKGAEKAYVLLREALARSKKMGLARFVLREREHLGVIKPSDHLLILEQMRFADELQSAKELELSKKVPIAEQELKMALTLIDYLTKPFHAEEYQDTYREEVERMIDDKVKGVIAHPKAKAKQATKTKDIMTLLRASLERAHKKAS